VLDVLGKVMTVQEVKASFGINQHELDLSAVRKGIYFVILTHEGQQFNLRLVVE
jgi:hypothetical protein